MKLLNFILTLSIVFSVVYPNSTLAILEEDNARIYEEMSIYFGGNVPGGGMCMSDGQYSEGGNVSDGTLSGYLDKFGQAAFDIGKEYGLPYEGILAQSAHETGWGQSNIAKQANNFFGIKAGSSWTGPVYSTRTHEVLNGADVMVAADFRAYPSPYAGFRGYADFIVNSTRYAAALNHPGDPRRYIQEIFAGGYATDPDYVSKVTATITSIENYIAENDLFPPSSEVDHDTSPPPASQYREGLCPSSGPAGRFVHYLQCDDRWRNNVLSRAHLPGVADSNICVGGCGPSAIAMVIATLHDSSVTPVEVAKFSNDNNLHQSEGSSWELMRRAPAEMTNNALEVQNYGDNLLEALETLNEGGLVIATGKDAPDPYTSGGHIIVIRQALDNGKYLVGDSANQKPLDHEYSFAEIDNGRQYWGVTKK